MKKFLQLPKRAGRRIISVGNKVKIYFHSAKSYLTLKIDGIERQDDSAPANELVELEDKDINRLLEDCCSPESDVTESGNTRFQRLKKTIIKLRLENGKKYSFVHQDRMMLSLCEFLKALQREPQNN